MGCEHCGGPDHRTLEICPAKPGLLEHCRMFWEGSREPETLFAVFGTAFLITLIVIAGLRIL